VLVVARLSPRTDDVSFRAEVRTAIEALATRPGHLRSRLGRALDDPGVWVLVSEWADVGSYRRALSSYDVRMATGPLMGAVADEPSAFETVEEVGSGEQAGPAGAGPH
jgi:quinol monooxygenase YgiN